MTLLDWSIRYFYYMRKSSEFKPKSNSYKITSSAYLDKNSIDIRQSSNAGGYQERPEKQSGIYDIRFKRKDLREFNPRFYVTANINEEDVIQLKQVFDYYDSAKMGVLLPNDLKILLNQNGFLPSKKTIYEIIAEFDQQETGGISFFEFMKAMDSKPYEKERKKDIYHIFKKYDRTNKGYINLNDLKEINKQVQEDIDQETMKLMISRASKGAGDKLNFQDFYQVMRKQVY